MDGLAASGINGEGSIGGAGAGVVDGKDWQAAITVIASPNITADRLIANGLLVIGCFLIVSVHPIVMAITLHIKLAIPNGNSVV